MKKSIQLIILILSITLSAQINVSTITSQFNGSGGLSLDEDGNLYIADFGDFLSGGDADGLPNNVWKLDTNLNLTVFSPGFVGASGNDFDSNGTLYQSDIGNGTIYKIVNGVRTFVSNTGLNAPVGLAFDSNDNLFVCNCGSNNIRKITFTAGGAVSSSTTFASGPASIFNCPNGITVDENDNLYVVNFSNVNIIKITPSGTTSIIGSTNAGNGHLDYDLITKNLYVASFQGHQIFSLNLEENPSSVDLLAGSGFSGNTDGTASSSSFRFPNGVAVSKTGDSIYVNSSLNPIPNSLNPQVIRLITGVLSTELSVETASPLLNFKTYPNPIKNEFTIESDLLSNYQDLSFKIFNIDGKTVKEIKTIETSNQRFKIVIDLSSLSSGTYLYSIFNKKNKLKNGKLIKE